MSNRNYVAIYLFLLTTGMHGHATATTHGMCFAEVRYLDGALELFRAQHDRYPSQAEGLTALVRRPPDIPSDKWSASIKQVPKDPWGNDYVYRLPGRHHPQSFDLYSLGKDGRSKTGGSDPDDINNWDANHSWVQYYSGLPVYDWAIYAALLIVALLCLVYARRCRLLRKRQAALQ